MGADSLQEMAEEIFGLSLMAWQERVRSRQGGAVELSESQFLTLDLLAKTTPLTVGELQRGVGVLPAQMSRIIRSLETAFDTPLIRCQLNPNDKRKIDVEMTDPGKKLYLEYRNSRLSKTREILGKLPDRERAEFVRICRHIRDLFHASAP